MTPGPGPEASSLTSALLAALEQTRAAACVTDAQLDEPGPRILYVNPAYCEMTGHTRDEVIGRNPRLMQGPLTDRGELDRLRADLTAGGSFSGETVNYRADGSPFIISWAIDPVRDPDGRITHFVATQQDVTRLRRAERLLDASTTIDRAVNEALTSASRDTSGDDPGLFDAFADSVTAALSIFAIVGSPAVRVHGPDVGTVQVSDDPDATSILDLVSDDATGGETGDTSWIGRAVCTPTAAVTASVAITGLDADELAFLDDAGLDTLADRIAVALEALSEYDTQRRTALRLQEDLLPARLDVTTVEWAARYRPGTDRTLVGGDWYDAIEIDTGTVLLVGDVAGSGLEAAATMGRLRFLTRGLLARTPTMSEALGIVDSMCATEDLFATLLAVRLDRGEPTATVCSAGHPPPVSVAAGQSPRIAPIDPGPPLGIGSNRARPETRVALATGDSVLLFTDGVVERRGESIDDGLARLVTVVEAGAGPEAICDTVLGSLGSHPADDVALLAATRIE